MLSLPSARGSPLPLPLARLPSSVLVAVILIKGLLFVIALGLPVVVVTLSILGVVVNPGVLIVIFALGILGVVITLYVLLGLIIGNGCAVVIVSLDKALYVALVPDGIPIVVIGNVSFLGVL